MTRRLAALALLLVPLQAAPPNVKLRGAELPLERYVEAVLAGESSVFQSDQALQAMAVAARTYAVRLRGRHASEGFDFCETTHCQRLDLNGVTPRLEAGATETAGELLWFEDKPAFTPYTRDCGGRTEDAAAIWPDLAAPYLKSHEDPYCPRAGSSAWQWRGDPQQIAAALRRSGLRSPVQLNRITILDRTASGRARTLMLAGGSDSVRISAGSFRFAVGRELGWNTLRSDRYEVDASNSRLQFEGAGSGHGVGLCQDGAEQMGRAGRSYREILAFYYPGTVVGLTGSGLSWQRLSGEAVTLWTVQPQQDRVVLAAAERLLRVLTEKTRWPSPAHLEIRVYPDMDTFRNATGEPGWVAAHAEGRRIHLQPVNALRRRGVLNSTLSHEFLHVLIEAQAAPGLPLWFHEGLAGYLERPVPPGAFAHPPADEDLRQTSDAARARKAYAQAEGAVATLVQRYGETAVLGWVKRGLPLEVTNASSKPQAMKSK